MADAPVSNRKFNDEEVALIIKRAAELQQTEQVAEDTSSALTLAEVEQIAKEAGIDPSLIRRAAQTLDRVGEEANRPSPWAGAPTRLVFERVIDGEVSPDEYENIIDTVRRTFDDNGMPSVLGRTLAWTSSMRAGRRRSHGRQINVNVVSRGGLTTIRVEEELRNIAGALFGGLVGGGGGGTTVISMGIGLGAFHSAALAGLLWVGIAGGFYTLARTIFTHTSEKREKQLRDLVNRLEEQVTASVAAKPAQVGASTPPTLAAGEGTVATG
jgi:hypothetical protein